MNPADIQAYIQEQPEVLRRVWEQVPRAVSKLEDFRESQSIYLVGSGTSRNALLATAPVFEKNLPGAVQVRGPLSFNEEVWSPPKGSSTAVVLSQTGTSTTTIQSVEHARRLGMRTITLTAEEGSPITRVSPYIAWGKAGSRFPAAPSTTRISWRRMRSSS